MKFLVFEGLDGSGKTTLIQRLSTELRSRGLHVVLTREPGGTPLGDELRNILLRTKGEAPIPRTELLLYEAIRAQHVEKVIRPALSAGSWVICDRYKASTVAFQSAGRNISADTIKWLNDYATDGVLADLTILLDLPVEESLKRMQNRETVSGVEADRFEREEKSFHAKVKESYLAQSSTEKNWLVLDALLTSDQLYTKLVSDIEARKWL